MHHQCAFECIISVRLSAYLISTPKKELPVSDLWQKKRKSTQAESSAHHISSGKGATAVPSTLNIFFYRKGKTEGNRDQKGC
jgi:hypothetical protein